MNVKLKVLSTAALFFLAQGIEAQTDTTKVKDIDEVVVVGYSTVKKEDYVGTATTVDAKALRGKSVSNVAQALTGEAAGVRVITTSGQPGSEPKIRVRGFGSVNGNREPLYVVDGMPYTGNVSAINPEDIESTTILKDATATAIYGARGANGVVLINTKKGRANRSQITLESKVGFNFQGIPRHSVMTSPEEYLETSWNAMYNKGVLSGEADPVAYANTNLFGRTGIAADYNMWNAATTDLIDPTTGRLRNGVGRLYTPERWSDYAFQTSIRTENNLAISGGSGKTTYYTGIGYLKDEGYSINSGYERYSGRLNLSHQAKSWLRGDFNMGYAYSKSRNNGQSRNSGSIFWFVDNIPSIYPLFLRNNGSFVTDPYYGGYRYDYGETGRGFGGLTNSIADATFNRNGRERHEINANFFLKADITDGLSFETRLGGQYYNSKSNIYNNPYYGSSASQGGYLYKGLSEQFSYNFLQLLRYKKRFGEGHNVEAFAAHEANSWTQNILQVSKYGLIIPDGKEFNNAINQNPANSYVYNYTLESYFGQLNYDFQNKYFLSASVRRDGTSRFIEKKWDTFYSVGLGWLVSKENFLKDSNAIRTLKLKTSYGTVGDQSIVDTDPLVQADQNMGYYPGYTVYNPGNFMGLPAAAFNRIGYPALTWEKSKIFQVGTEMSLLKNKAIDITLDYYHKTTDQLIFDNRLAPSTGNALMKVNDGLLVNQGFEFNVVGHIINKENFYLDLSVNGELLRNKLTQMPVDFSTGERKTIDVAGNFGRSAGRSLFDYYMRDYVGVNPQTGAATWIMNFDDKNNNGVYDSGDVIITSLYEYQKDNAGAVIGETTTENYANATQKYLNKSAIPDIRGAFTLSAGYKGVSVSAQMLYSFGGYAYDGAYAALMHNNQIGSNNWHTDIRNRWQNPGDITDVPRLSSNYTADTRFNAASSRFLTKSDYLVLNNVRVAYDLPRKYYEGIGLTGLTLSVSGDNLWIQTKRNGFNPTTSESGASDTYTYSPLSTITFGVRANF